MIPRARFVITLGILTLKMDGVDTKGRLVENPYIKEALCHVLFNYCKWSDSQMEAITPHPSIPWSEFLSGKKTQNIHTQLLPLLDFFCPATFFFLGPSARSIVNERRIPNET